MNSNKEFKYLTINCKKVIPKIIFNILIKTENSLTIDFLTEEICKNLNLSLPKLKKLVKQLLTTFCKDLQFRFPDLFIFKKDAIQFKSNCMVKSYDVCFMYRDDNDKPKFFMVSDNDIEDFKIIGSVIYDKIFYVNEKLMVEW